MKWFDIGFYVRNIFTTAQAGRKSTTNFKVAKSDLIIIQKSVNCLDNFRPLPPPSLPVYYSVLLSNTPPWKIQVKFAFPLMYTNAMKHGVN